MKDFGILDALHQAKTNSVVVVGSSGSGKSYFTRYLLEQWYSEKKFDYYYCMSGTIGESGLMDCFHSKLFVPLDKINFLKFIKVSKTLGAQGKKGLLVLDDMSTVSREVRASPQMLSIWMDGRHWGLTVIACVQSAILLEPRVRSNTSIWVSFYLRDNEDELFHLKKSASCGGMKEFNDLYTSMRQDFLDNYGLISFKVSSKINGLPYGGYLRVRAPAKIPAFRIGCQL